MTSKDFALIRFELATSNMPQKICPLKRSHQAKKRYSCRLWNLADLLNHINQSLLKIFKKHKQFQLTLDFNFVSYLYLCYAASFALRMSKLRGFHLNEQLTLTTLGVVCRLQFLEAAATPPFDRRGTGTKEQLARLGNDLWFNEGISSSSHRIRTHWSRQGNWGNMFREKLIVS